MSYTPEQPPNPPEQQPFTPEQSSYTPEQPPYTPEQLPFTPEPLPNPLTPASSPVDQDNRTWAMLVHLSTFIGSFIGPLVILLVKKDQMPFVEAHAKEALNFQISILIYFIVALVASFITCFILSPILIAVPIFSLVFTIIAAVKANEGVLYRYPLNIRFIN